MVVPLAWQPKKLGCVTKNPLASETMTLDEGADAGYLIGNLMQKIFMLPNFPGIKCMTVSLYLTPSEQKMSLKIYNLGLTQQEFNRCKKMEKYWFIE